jgi:hypothetical protein
VVQSFDEEQHRDEEGGRDADGEEIHVSSVRPGPSTPYGGSGRRHQDAVKTLRAQRTYGVAAVILPP